MVTYAVAMSTASVVGPVSFGAEEYEGSPGLTLPIGHDISSPSSSLPIDRERLEDSLKGIMNIAQCCQAMPWMRGNCFLEWDEVEKCDNRGCALRK